MKNFAECRPTGIYKEDYLQELFNRYDDVSATPPAPPMPDWCTGLLLPSSVVYKEHCVIDPKH